MNRTSGIALAVLLSAFPSWAGDNAQRPAAELFRAHCASCHGDDGAGAKEHKVSGANRHATAVQSLSDAELFEAIAYSSLHKQYVHGFVARGVLTPNDVHLLVQYVRGMGTKKK